MKPDWASFDPPANLPICAPKPYTTGGGTCRQRRLDNHDIHHGRREPNCCAVYARAHLRGPNFLCTRVLMDCMHLDHVEPEQFVTRRSSSSSTSHSSITLISALPFFLIIGMEHRAAAAAAAVTLLQMGGGGSGAAN